MRNEQIRIAKLILAEYFARYAGGGTKAPVQQVQQYVKSMRCGITRAELREARKEMGIGSTNEGGNYYWCWNSSKTAEEEWARRWNEMFGGGGKCENGTSNSA